MALTDNLVAYWSLDEASGDRADSHSMNTLFDVSAVGSTTGKVGNAADFLASSDDRLASSESNANLAMGDIDFTIAYWVRQTSVSGARAHIAKTNGSTTATWEYYIRGNNTDLQFWQSNGSTAVNCAATGVLSINTWYFVVAVNDATNNEARLYINAGTPTTVAQTLAPQTDTAAVMVGARSGDGTADDFSHEIDGQIDELGIWKRALTSEEITELYNSGSGRDYAYISGAGGADYTLDADAGSYTVTGQATDIVANRLLTTDAGEYALTGLDATLAATRQIALDAGNYTITGLDATLTYNELGAYNLVAEPGSYTITGYDVGLVVGRQLALDAGSYTVTGHDAALLRGYPLVVDAGSYAITGHDATLLIGRALALDLGAYLITGLAVALTYSGEEVPVTPDSRVFVIAAADRSFVVAAENRAFAIAAEDRTHAVQGA